ncbi:MAG: cytochrome c [Gammaproteobacteria bacterium]
MKTLIVLSCVVMGIAGTQAAFADTPPSVQQEQGHAVFQRWCEPCHGRAPHLPATSALTIKYQGKLPGALEDRKELTVAAVKTFVRQGAFSMPPFRKTEVSDADLETLARYLAGKRAR